VTQTNPFPQSPAHGCQEPTAFSERDGARSTAPDVSVCIATFRRPAQLAKLLGVLTAREGPIAISQLAVEIVVCDNDHRQSAAPVVAQAAAQAQIPVGYVCEPIQSIARARNRLVQASRGSWIAFIDDDELPAANWLLALWRVVQNPGTAGAKGPVYRCLPADAPQWLSEMPYRGANLPAAGTPLAVDRLSGGNILLRRSLLGIDEVGSAPFDIRFGLRGGEDILAYGRLVLGGSVIRAAPDAIVQEIWDTSRVSLAWFLRRAFRSGQVWADVEALLYGGARKAVRVPVAMIRLLGLLPRLGVAMVGSRGRRARCLIQAAALLGQASVMLPLRYEGYRARDTTRFRSAAARSAAGPRT